MARRGLGILALLFILSCEEEPPAPLPTANFYVDNNNCTSPCYVHFFDQSYSAVQWQWEFGNGITSSYADDSTQYGTPGVYNVKLTVWNADNVQDEITKSVVVY